jgi:hypothetical protein
MANSAYKIIRVNNYLLSFGINNSSLCEDDDVNREPTEEEYDMLLTATEEFFSNFFESLMKKTNCGTFVKLVSAVKSKSYNQEKIPDEKYQICIHYSYTDIYFTNDSVLTDDMESSPEVISTFSQ